MKLSLKKNKTTLVPIITTFFIVIIEFAISFNSVLLPDVKLNFGISDQLAQATISIGLFALGIAGVIYGGITDSFGRKPMMVFSVSIFSLSTLLIAYSTNINIFLIAKFTQGIGSGAGWVIGNACLKDLYSEKDYAKVMNYVHSIAGITPSVAPVIGSYLGVLIGWRNCFQVLFLFSLIALTIMLIYQPETLKEKKDFSLKEFTLNYKTIFSKKLFIKYLTVKVLTVMLILTESSILPLLFVDYMNVEPQSYGLYAFPVFIFYVLGNFISGKLVYKYEAKTMIYTGLIAIFISNLLVIITSYLTTLSPLLIQILKTPCYLGWGFIFGNATAEIVSSASGKAAPASAIMIALEMLFSACGINILAVFFNGTIIPLTLFLLFISLFCIIFMYLFQTK